MAQFVKYLSGKCKDLSSDPQHSRIALSVGVHVCKPGIGVKSTCCSCRALKFESQHQH